MVATNLALINKNLLDWGRAINPIPLDILRFRVKTMPQIKRKRQGVPNCHPLEANSVKIRSFLGLLAVYE